MSNWLRTNCPNCGGNLTFDGKCPYCDTKIRAANEMRITLNDYLSFPDKIEIDIKVKQSDGNVAVIPFIGHLESVTHHIEPVYADYLGGKRVILNNGHELKLVLTGRARETIYPDTLEGN